MSLSLTCAFLLDCPLVFKYLRERFGIDDLEYRESLTRASPVPMDAAGKVRKILRPRLANNSNMYFLFAVGSKVLSKLR